MKVWTVLYENSASSWLLEYMFHGDYYRKVAQFDRRMKAEEIAERLNEWEAM